MATIAKVLAVWLENIIETTTTPPPLTQEVIDLLKEFPRNKKGWHYLSFKGRSVQFKSGYDYRRAPKLYYLVKVDGLVVKRIIGHPQYCHFQMQWNKNHGYCLTQWPDTTVQPHYSITESSVMEEQNFHNTFGYVPVPIMRAAIWAAKKGHNIDRWTYTRDHEWWLEKMKMTLDAVKAVSPWYVWVDDAAHCGVISQDDMPFDVHTDHEIGVYHTKEEAQRALEQWEECDDPNCYTHGYKW